MLYMQENEPNISIYEHNPIQQFQHIKAEVHLSISVSLSCFNLCLYISILYEVASTSCPDHFPCLLQPDFSARQKSISKEKINVQASSFTCQDSSAASSCKSDSLLLLNDLSLIVSRRGLQARTGLGDRYPIELTSSWQKSVGLLLGEPINTLDPTLLACDLIGLAPGLVVPGIFGSGLGALAFSVSFFTRLAKFTGETSGWRVEKGSRKYRRPGSSSALRARGLEKGERS